MLDRIFSCKSTTEMFRRALPLSDLTVDMRTSIRIVMKESGPGAYALHSNPEAAMSSVRPPLAPMEVLIDPAEQQQARKIRTSDREYCNAV
jgi:hypothetical protein